MWQECTAQVVLFIIVSASFRIVDVDLHQVSRKYSSSWALLSFVLIWLLQETVTNSALPQRSHDHLVVLLVFQIDYWLGHPLLLAKEVPNASFTAHVIEALPNGVHLLQRLLHGWHKVLFSTWILLLPLRSACGCVLKRRWVVISNKFQQGNLTWLNDSVRLILL